MVAQGLVSTASDRCSNHQSIHLACCRNPTVSWLLLYHSTTMVVLSVFLLVTGAWVGSLSKYRNTRTASRSAKISTTRLPVSPDESDSGAARALLFQDQSQALETMASRQAEILDPIMTKMKQVPVPKRKKRSRQSAGSGFGGKATESKADETVVDAYTEILATNLQENGVVLVPEILQPDFCQDLRACLYHENDLMRKQVEEDPTLSRSLFYVPADILFSSNRGYVLLPFRETASVNQGPTHKGTIVQAAQRLLSPEAKLARLFGHVCDGDSSQLYDFCALRTEPGADRQVIHSDTPIQDIPGLFCAFVALQDVTMAMGGTLFLPKTHVQSPARRDFDRGKTEAILKASKPEYTMLKAGDAAVFDMRTLHAGLPNLAETGANRLLMAITFRNTKATESLGHKPNLRPGYVGQYTLGQLQEDLMADSPFLDAGNGLL